MNQLSSKLKIIGASVGDPRSVGTYSGVPFHLFQELRVTGALSGLVRSDILRTSDLLRGLLDVRRTVKARRPRRNAYWRFLPESIDLLSRRFRKALQRFDESDAVLQFGVAGTPQVSRLFVAHLEISVKCAAEEPAFAHSYGFASGQAKYLGRAMDGEKAFMNRCDVIWTNSSWTMETFRWAGIPPDRFWVHPPACNASDPGRVDRDWATPRILFIGKDWARKGGGLLVNAFRELRRSFPEALLHIVGCRPEIVEPGVEVVGFLSKDDPVENARLQKLLQEATMFCMPSLWESVGLVYMEAALYGLPVVMQKGQSREEIFPRSMAVHLETGHPAELTAEMRRLAGNPEYARKMGAVGREHVLANFTWPIVTRRLLLEIERRRSLMREHRQSGQTEHEGTPI